MCWERLCRGMAGGGDTGGLARQSPFCCCQGAQRTDKKTGCPGSAAQIPLSLGGLDVAELQSVPTRDGKPPLPQCDTPTEATQHPAPSGRTCPQLPWVPPQRGESLGRAGLGAGPC